MSTWTDKLAEMDLIVDGRGMYIDTGIKETVAALQLLGFETQMSCEGHVDHGSPYPWVFVKNSEESLDGLKTMTELFPTILVKEMGTALRLMVGGDDSTLHSKQAEMRRFTEFLKSKLV